MTNRFTQPVQSPVMSNYVPIPFEAMAQAGQMTQQRYQQAMTVEQGMEDLMGSAKGISSVDTKTMGPKAAYGQVRVDKELTKFRDKLTKLQEDNPDITSMGYMAGLRSTYNSLKRSMTSGVLGQEAANYTALQDIYKKRSENTDLENDPSLGINIDKALLEYAGAGADENAPILNSNIGIPDYLDLDEEVSKAAKEVKKTLEREGFAGSGLEDYEKWVQESEVSEDRILNVASRKITGSPAIMNTIRRRAEQQAYAEGNTSKEHIAKLETEQMADLLLNATDKYVTRSTVNRFLKTGDGSGTKLSGAALVRDFTMQVPGMKNYDYSSVLADYATLQGESKTTQEEKEQYMKDYNINPQTLKGNDNNYDYTKVLEEFDKRMGAADHKAVALYDKMIAAAKYAGFDEEDFKNKLNTVAELEERTRSANKTMGKFFKEEDNSAKALSGLTSAISRHIPEWFSALQSDRFKTYMEKNYSPTGIEVAIQSPLKGLVSNPMMKLNAFASSFEGSIEDIKDAKTGESWTSTNYEEFDPDNAVLLGDAYDPAEGGKPILIYVLPSRNGTDTKLVKVDPPNNYAALLDSKGLSSDFERTIVSQLFTKESHIATSKNAVPVKLGNTMSNTDMQRFKDAGYNIKDKGDLVMDFKVLGPAATGAGWQVSIPSINSKGEEWDDTRPANDMAEITAIIESVYSTYLRELKKK